MKRRKCANKPCENLSRRFEGKFCCIECADFHDGVIGLQEWAICMEFYTNPRLFESRKRGFSGRWA